MLLVILQKIIMWGQTGWKFMAGIYFVAQSHNYQVIVYLWHHFKVSRVSKAFFNEANQYKNNDRKPTWAEITCHQSLTGNFPFFSHMRGSGSDILGSTFCYWISTFTLDWLVTMKPSNFMAFFRKFSILRRVGNHKFNAPWKNLACLIPFFGIWRIVAYFTWWQLQLIRCKNL